MSGVNNTPDYVKRMELGEVVPPYPGNDVYSVNVTNSAKLGGIVSVYYLGTLIGAMLGGWLGDKLGRINVIRIGCAWSIFGAALQTAAMNSNWMICARVINGIGTGHLNAAVPVWSAETSAFSSRGFFIAMEFTLNIFGVVVAYWLEYGLSYINQGDSVIRWRFPIAFQIIFLIALAILVNFMPESPRYLVKAGRDDEALKVLARLRSDGNINDVHVIGEYKDIKENAEEDSTLNTTYIGMFFKSQGRFHIRRRVHLVIWLQIVQEWVGIAAITVYQPTIFSQAGFDTNKSNWLSGLNNIFYMLSTLVAVFTLDRWGRRISLYWGAVGQGIAIFLAGGMSRLAQNTGNNQYGAASAAFVFIYTFVFGATWLTVPWIYPAEIWPVQVRMKGNAWGVVGWSIGNGWLMMLNPVMFDAIAEKTLYIFGACNFAAIAMVWAFYPETANRTLEEIDDLFSAPMPWSWDAEKSLAEAKKRHHSYQHEILNNPEAEKHALENSIGHTEDAHEQV